MCQLHIAESALRQGGLGGLTAFRLDILLLTSTPVRLWLLRNLGSLDTEGDHSNFCAMGDVCLPDCTFP